MPAKPSAAAFRSTSTGKCFSSSHLAECGASSAAAKADAASWIARWSSVRSKFMEEPLAHGRDDERRVCMTVAFRPARRDGLDLGVELHALEAVLVGVAKRAALPAAEGVIGHRHRDRSAFGD